jgi:hypothetical protein
VSANMNASMYTKKRDSMQEMQAQAPVECNKEDHILFLNRPSIH